MQTFDEVHSKDLNVAIMNGDRHTPHMGGYSIPGGVRLADAPEHMPDWFSSLSAQPCKALLSDGVSEVTVPDTFAIIRDTDNKVLGTGGKQMIQGLAGGQRLAETIRRVTGESNPLLESIGFMKGGSRLFAQVKLSEFDVTRNDPIRSYLFFAEGLDGSLKTVVNPTDFRFACANMMATMMIETAKYGIGVRHTKNHNNRLERAEEIMAAALRQTRQRGEVYLKMAKARITDGDAHNYFRKAIDADTTVELKELPTRTQNNLNRIQELYASGDDLAAENQGTVWGAFNALTNYANHEITVHGEFADKDKTKLAPGGAEKRLDSVIFGRGAKVNSNAYRFGVQLAQAA